MYVPCVYIAFYPRLRLTIDDLDMGVGSTAADLDCWRIVDGSRSIRQYGNTS